MQSSGFALIGLAAMSRAAVHGFSRRFFDTCIIDRCPPHARQARNKKAVRRHGLHGSCRRTGVFGTISIGTGAATAACFA
ncbi:hypothetical protein Bcep18194_A3264 [Burkholderia lata]|uniref:Uncharacterized protein n=1 Tax=Burkholderia lata (strain ATCC 17760 / DSM 23089 / LMG 22485 / NCIMB 9086 / R18194 / 383) TaxID=482957 RepID=Q39L00_BURL3|nr:hypothetical protein Bcep18194_A3264 [Burkholderia lata]